MSARCRSFGYLYGWDNLQAKISKLAADNGAQWVDAQDYSLTGWLGYYGKMADDPLPVYDRRQRLPLQLHAADERRD